MWLEVYCFCTDENESRGASMRGYIYYIDPELRIGDCGFEGRTEGVRTEQKGSQEHASYPGT